MSPDHVVSGPFAGIGRDEAMVWRHLGKSRAVLVIYKETENKIKRKGNIAVLVSNADECVDV